MGGRARRTARDELEALGATSGPDARITIRDDDPPRTVRVADASVRETDGLRFAQVPVRLSTATA